jgi:hypothetical protein
MGELTPKANALLVEFQNYALGGYKATCEEWEAFGRKAVSALYEVERALAGLNPEAVGEMLEAAKRYEESLLPFGNEEEGIFHVGDELLLEEFRAALAKLEPSDDSHD